MQRILVILAMTWSVTAFGHHMGAGINTEASELDANLTRLPAYRSGLLTERACAGCLAEDAETYRVDENTTYHVGHRTPAVSLKDFRLAMAAAKRNDRVRAGVESDIGLLVIYDEDTRVAEKVVLETWPVRETS